MLPLEHATELIHHLEGLRHRIDALDVAATGICAGMRLNTLGGEAAYQLLDMISEDLKARTDAALRLLTAARPPAVTPLVASFGQVVPSAAGRGSPPMPASSAAVR